MKDLYHEIVVLLGTAVYEAQDIRQVAKKIIKLYDQEVIEPMMKLVNTAHEKCVDKDE